jgi:hypothetical protein
MMIDEKRKASAQAPLRTGVEFHPGDSIKVVDTASRYLGWTGRVRPAESLVYAGKVSVSLDMPSCAWPFPICVWMKPDALELVSRYKKPRLRVIQGGRDEQAGTFDALF